MSEITIKDAGPIEALTIPCEPGITVLRGPNDEGKSEALKLCDRLSGGKQKVAKRHDAAGAGSVEGFGAKITLGGSVRQKGTLEAYSMSGKFDIGELIQPPVKEPVAADKVRIRSFLALTGAEADIRLFGDGTEDATKRTLDATDLVEMASGLKSDYEELAREHEDAAKVAEGKAAACKEAAEGVDMTGESDADILQAAVEAAIAEKARCDELILAKQARKERLEAAEAKLAEATASYTGLSVEEAEGIHEVSEIASVDATAFVRDLESQLDYARKIASNAQDKVTADLLVWQHAIEYERIFSTCNATIAAQHSGDDLTGDDIQAAVVALTEARDALEQGAMIRNAKSMIANREAHLEDSATRKGKATTLRLSAKATEQVLSEAVQSEELTVKDGRLVTKKDGKEVFFADRSRGYRCRVAMTIAADQIRKAGAEKAALIVLPQEHWEGLDIGARNGLAAQAKELGVCIITGEASSREGDPKKLTATAFESEG